MSFCSQRGKGSLSGEGLCPAGGSLGGSLSGILPTYGKERAVRILLECILVFNFLVSFLFRCLYHLNYIRPYISAPLCSAKHFHVHFPLSYLKRANYQSPGHPTLSAIFGRPCMARESCYQNPGPTYMHTYYYICAHPLGLDNTMQS